jgi:hypothetical protein
MARDYYPPIARAVAGLDKKTAEARSVVYDHARTVLVRQLRDANHGLSIGLKELDALEEAIRKAESELLEPERAQTGCHISPSEPTVTPVPKTEPRFA